LGGDWQQLMPVLVGYGLFAMQAQFIASIKNSVFFDVQQPYHFVTKRLKINVRLDPTQVQFRGELKQIAVAANSDCDGNVLVPAAIRVNNIQELISFVFDRDALSDPIGHGNTLNGCAILCPINEEMFHVNDRIMVNSLNLLIISHQI
jgi:hypothetical protein